MKLFENELDKMKLDKMKLFENELDKLNI